jgi:outer membrane immunogenic protein
MRNRVIGATAIALINLGAAAHAADFDYGRGPYTVREYGWAGPYLGGNLGYQWGTVTNNPTQPNGIEAGVQGGYNWQYGQFVFGGEADLQFSGSSDQFASWKFSSPWFGSLRGRAGLAVNNILLYGTAGLAFGELDASNFAISETHATAGWTAGLGAEVGFARNWSAKLEYLFVDLSETPFTLTAMQNGYHFNVVRLGVNYRF